MIQIRIKVIVTICYEPTVFLTLHVSFHSVFLPSNLMRYNIFLKKQRIQEVKLSAQGHRVCGGRARFQTDVLFQSPVSFH